MSIIAPSSPDNKPDLFGPWDQGTPSSDEGKGSPAGGSNRGAFVVRRVYTPSIFGRARLEEYSTRHLSPLASTDYHQSAHVKVKRIYDGHFG